MAERQIITPCWPTFLPSPRFNHPPHPPFPHSFSSYRHLLLLLLLSSLLVVTHLDNSSTWNNGRPNSDYITAHELQGIITKRNYVFSAVTSFYFVSPTTYIWTCFISKEEVGWVYSVDTDIMISNRVWRSILCVRLFLDPGRRSHSSVVMRFFFL